MSHGGEGSVSHAVVVAVLCSVVSDSETPCTEARQAPLSMGFSRQEYWSGLPFPSPGDLSDPGLEPKSPCLLRSRWILDCCTTWKAPISQWRANKGSQRVYGGIFENRAQQTMASRTTLAHFLLL